MYSASVVDIAMTPCLRENQIIGVLILFHLLICVCLDRIRNQTLTRNIDEDGNPGPFIDVPYRQLIGSLMYLAVGTRADISFVVSALSQFLENPSELHWRQPSE